MKRAFAIGLACFALVIPAVALGIPADPDPFGCGSRTVTIPSAGSCSETSAGGTTTTPNSVGVSSRTKQSFSKKCKPRRLCRGH